MKSIVKFLNESSMKFSKEELYEDYNKASDVTGQEKKDLIVKYGIETKKAQDIKNKILLLLRDLRNEKKTFDNQDITDFLRLHDYVTSRMVEGLKNEPKEFSTYLKDYYFDRLKSRKLDQYSLSTSLSSYRFSIADKDLIRTYQKISKAVDEINPTKEKLTEKEHFEMLNNRITELMQDFKVIYLKRIEESLALKIDYEKNNELHGKEGLISKEGSAINMIIHIVAAFEFMMSDGDSAFLCLVRIIKPYSGRHNRTSVF